MTGLRRSRSAAVLPSWPLFRAPVQCAAWLVLVDLVAAGWSLGRLASSDVENARAWYLLALLAPLAIVFEECARRAARLKLRLSTGMTRDMTSVWCVAGAVVLPSLQAALLVSAILCYVWFRQHRPAGQLLHRKLFNGATAILGTLAAGATVQMAHPHLEALPLALAGTVAIGTVIVVHTIVNRCLVTVAALSLGMRGRQLLGTRDDNMIEIATLCLGGLVAAAVTFEPWSAVFVLVPMMALQRGALVRELEAAATIDAKTGLLNAVAWEQLAQTEIGRAARESQAVGVLIIDIDRFKDVNDRYGHLAGDRVLAAVGKAIQSALREYDGLGRFGGEEFVAVLPDVPGDAALIVAERVRSRINQLSVQDLVGADATGHQISVSVGVACTPVDGDDLPALLHRADQALYDAKAAGRNRVRLARRDDGIDKRVTV